MLRWYPQGIRFDTTARRVLRHVTAVSERLRRHRPSGDARQVRHVVPRSAAILYCAGKCSVIITLGNTVPRCSKGQRKLEERQGGFCYALGHMGIIIVLSHCFLETQGLSRYSV